MYGVYVMNGHLQGNKMDVDFPFGGRAVRELRTPSFFPHDYNSAPLNGKMGQRERPSNVDPLSEDRKERQQHGLCSI